MQPQTTLNNEKQDWRLLVDRLRAAPFDEQGHAFVRKGIGVPDVLDKADAGILLAMADIARQHGLVRQARSIYEQLHGRFPRCGRAWREHLELAGILDDRAALVRLKARAESSLPADELARLPLPGTTTEPADSEQDGADWLEPFTELRQEEKEVSLFMRLFRGRDDAFARQWHNRGEGRHGYVPVRRPMQPDDVREHLLGRKTYGIYLLNKENRVLTGVIDVDLVQRLRDAAEAKKQAPSIRRESLYLHQRIMTLAGEAGLCCLAEVSGGKGYHFWFPVREPVEAAAMRAALQGLIHGLDSDVECFSLEVFPKQDRRTGKGFGNLVKLPLGIHRATGKPSFFLLAADRNRKSQFEYLTAVRPAPAQAIIRLGEQRNRARIMVHPRQESWAKEYPELAVLEQRCAMLGQIMAGLRSARSCSMREEKILLGTIGHLPRARFLLHHLFAHLPEYNRPLLDYRISRIRGTVLGCKRIHRLLDQGNDLPCSFDRGGYPHPLLHLDGYSDSEQPKSARAENMADALLCLKTAIRQVERFLEAG